MAGKAGCHSECSGVAQTGRRLGLLRVAERNSGPIRATKGLNLDPAVRSQKTGVRSQNLATWLDFA